MAKDKKSVLLYCDIIHTVKELTDEEAGKLFKHYLQYINDMNPVAPDKLTHIVFEPIKQTLKRDLRKWENKSERNSLISKEGWVKRKDANACERIKDDAKDADSVKVIVKDKVIVKERKKFTPPSIIEFKNYFKENGYREDVAERAWKGYDAAVWHDTSGKPVLNWKQKCQNVWFKDENKSKEVNQNVKRDYSGVAQLNIKK